MVMFLNYNKKCLAIWKTSSACHACLCVCVTWLHPLRAIPTPPHPISFVASHLCVQVQGTLSSPHPTTHMEAIPKRKVILQPSIFRGKALSFREGTLNFRGYVYMLLQAQATASTCGTNRPLRLANQLGPLHHGVIVWHQPPTSCIGFFSGKAFPKWP